MAAQIFKHMLRIPPGAQQSQGANDHKEKPVEPQQQFGQQRQVKQIGRQRQNAGGHDHAEIAGRHARQGGAQFVQQARHDGRARSRNQAASNMMGSPWRSNASSGPMVPARIMAIICLRVLSTSSFSGSHGEWSSMAPANTMSQSWPVWRDSSISVSKS